MNRELTASETSKRIESAVKAANVLMDALETIRADDVRLYMGIVGLTDMLKAISAIMKGTREAVEQHHAQELFDLTDLDKAQVRFVQMGVRDIEEFSQVADQHVRKSPLH